MHDVLLFLAVGAVAGVMAGLFGVGGGLIMVPALAVTLPRQYAMSSDLAMHMAVGTSLAVIALTSISSTRSHHRRNGVLWAAFWRFGAGLAAGALLGAFVADLLPGSTLRAFVGVGALLVAVQMLLDRGGATGTDTTLRAGSLELFGAGTVIGLMSSLIGIGGGSMTVPYLTARGAPMRQAVGTSAAGGMPIAWAGAIGFMLAGLGTPGLPPGSVGYVSVAGFIALGIASVLTAPLGVRLAHWLPPRVLKRSFAVLLIAVSFHMLRGA